MRTFVLLLLLKNDPIVFINFVLLLFFRNDTIAPLKEVVSERILQGY